MISDKYYNQVDLTGIPNYENLVLYETLFPVASNIFYYHTNGTFSTNLNYTYDKNTGLLSLTGTNMNTSVNTVIDIYYIPQ